ncbi:MAG TPA: H-NS histone family protein [Rhodocyclaceae bacterium]|nr:H-NS histone family protein [Rhodocyclaceae bacterium]
MDISGLPLAELKRLLVQIPKEIERRQKEEKSKVLKEIESFAAERGFALDELIGERGKKERAPVAAKYRHPSNQELTWSGRGRQPKWVAEFVQKGGKMDQLKV